MASAKLTMNGAGRLLENSQEIDNTSMPESLPSSPPDASRAHATSEHAPSECWLSSAVCPAAWEGHASQLCAGPAWHRASPRLPMILPLSRGRDAETFPNRHPQESPPGTPPADATHSPIKLASEAPLLLLEKMVWRIPCWLRSRDAFWAGRPLLRLPRLLGTSV